MNIETISTPLPAASPQQRYATLHRSIEKGIASDETWSQLTRVCVELGLQGEALTAFHSVRGTSERFHLQNLLLRHGILREPDRGLQRWAEGEDRGCLREDLEEAAGFLASDHMGVTLVVTTATFPIVVGLSGYLTSGSSSEIVRLLAVIPALLVLVAIGSLARRVLLDSARGFDDVPDLPAPDKVGHEALRFGAEALPTIGLMLAPAGVFHLLGLSWPYVVVALAVGAMLLPMAWILRTVRGDWAALGSVLWRATHRGGVDYAARAACVVGLLVPAFGLLYLAGNAAIYLQLALVGPLLVAPMLFAARLMGRFLYARRASLREFFEVEKKSQTSTAPAALWEPTEATDNRERRPTARRLKPAPNAAPASQATNGAAQERLRRAASRQQARPGSRARPEPQSPRDPQGGQRKRAPTSVRTAPPQSQPARPTQPKQPPPPPETSWEGDLGIDLLSLPGVKVVTGADRQRAGATRQP